ncbi:hypothetical protein [Subdoligranulum variabile]|uniref:hypothetical protein n=1 Tax=Subdoligranulum variabile TaxID=214851 RepID=UPI0026EE109A|nr:hypothetical protein [Subdoligranulum variabile]
MPVISLYPDFDKKATTFFAIGYALLHHGGGSAPRPRDFVKSAGNSGIFAVKKHRFANLTEGVIRAVIGKTFQQPVQNSPQKWWKSW